MILIGSKRIQEDPEIFSLRFTGRDMGLCVYGEGMGGVVDFFLEDCCFNLTFKYNISDANRSYELAFQVKMGGFF